MLNMTVILTFKCSGGLELLCDSEKIHDVRVDPENGAGTQKSNAFFQNGSQLIMKDLLSWVRSNLIKERPEMFMKGDTVRPGVLVLVNDCDWELSGQLDTPLEEKDVVVFISTLHGG
ncbi:Ubiquitin-related modifier 1-like 1 [Cucurbita argyrosperma subsp. argyrosperma]|nr:Ubiquitin-related modifier 1-like 1 [Cucurbita argyrosperma subsp. argyrosperma]